MRGPWTHATALSILAAACVASAGCSDEPSRVTADRHARRFIPFDSAWIPEAEVPQEAPDSPNLWEVTETLEPPGPEEKKATLEWLARCYESAQRNGWHDYEKGLADGWEMIVGERAGQQVTFDPYHYQNKAYVLDDRILDPDRPEYLMSYPTPDGTRGLAGFMFFTRRLDERGPQFAGRLTTWHYHVWAKPHCVVQGVLALDFAAPDGTCATGEPLHRSPEMIHTWLIDHPKGPFATSMILPPKLIVAALEKRLRQRGF